MWEGRTEVVGTSLSRLEASLGSRRDRPIVNVGARLRGMRSDESEISWVREQFTQVRRIKDDIEISLIRRAAAATAAGFSKVRKQIRPGVTERMLQTPARASRNWVEQLKRTSSRLCSFNKTDVAAAFEARSFDP
jgi:Xaa-Pro aminopeptidase